MRYLIYDIRFGCRRGMLTALVRPGSCFGVGEFCYRDYGIGGLGLAARGAGAGAEEKGKEQRKVGGVPHG